MDPDPADIRFHIRHIRLDSEHARAHPPDVGVNPGVNRLTRKLTGPREVQDSFGAGWRQLGNRSGLGESRPVSTCFDLFR
ncbi:MAG: hypothetical protein M3N56_16620, partial [Actinomycetota bacterium]|nr:hypothetical protein [Actinomycetota bacterium]